MFRNYSIFTLILAFLTIPALAQNSAWFNLNQDYKSGIELLEKGKYAAAANQFNRVLKNDQKSNVKAEINPEISLLKENTRYYIALCALELGNSDAESLFQSFISANPANNFTKLAFYQVGRSYFALKNYPKVIEWLKKLEGTGLSGKESYEYRYKLAYSHERSKKHL